MTNIIRKISFFAQNLKEAYREQRIAFHLEKNTKEIAKYKQWEELQKRLNPAVHSGKVINYSPLVLGYADCPILYREDAASALSKFLKKKIAPEEMVLSGLENNFLYSKFNIVFFTTVWCIKTLILQSSEQLWERNAASSVFWTAECIIFSRFNRFAHQEPLSLPIMASALMPCRIVLCIMRWKTVMSNHCLLSAMVTATKKIPKLLKLIRQKCLMPRFWLPQKNVIEKTPAI